MSKLIPLEEAAKLLSITPERLVEMISKKQIFGYRDGSSWKFKQQEIERVADEFGLDIGGIGGDADSDEFSIGDSSLNEDLILEDSSSEDEDFELSDDLDSLSSKASDKGEGGGLNEDSGYDFSSDSSELILSDSSSDLSLEPETPKAKAAAAGVGDEDDLLLFGDSSLDLAAGDSKKSKGDSDVHDNDLLLSDDVAGSTGKLLKAMSDRVGDSKDEISLSEDELFDDDLRLADSDSLDDAVDLSSDYEDSDIVLDDSDSSSELVLESNERGISLGPNDSGIELSGGLELEAVDGDDFELPDGGIISLSEAAESDAATMMQDDDFNLTPYETSEPDDSSGSQVIALEDSDLFASESDSTLLNESDMVAQPQMLTETPLQPDSVPTAGVGAAAPEIPFTMWQNIALALAASVLLLGLPIVFDTARNLWMPSDQITHNGILNMILELTGMK